MKTDVIRLRLKTSLERTLNIISIVAVVLVAIVLVRNHARQNEVVKTGHSVSANSLRIAANWAGNRVTLVMALSVACHWCKASAPFYRDLLAMNQVPAFQTIAVFPQSVPLAQAYAQSLGITIKDIRQVNFQQLGIEATPALFIVDASGSIRSKWIGKLSPEEEVEFRKQLGGSGNPEPDTSGIIEATDLMTASEFRLLFDSERMLPVIDIRPRSIYKNGHIFQSLNIPQDELEMRAIHEIPKEFTVVLYCHYCLPCESHAKDHGVATYCTTGKLLLRRAGFSKIKILKEDLAHLRSTGIPITSRP